MAAPAIPTAIVPAVAAGAPPAAGAETPLETSPVQHAVVAAPAALTTARDRLLGVGLLCVIAAALFADQNLMAPNLTAIARDFGLSARQRDVLLGGHVQFAFNVLASVTALGVGYLADRRARRPLFVLVVYLGALPCLFAGLARTYDEFFWMRALTGVGIGGASPLIYSLLGDLFPPAQRGRASSLFFLSSGIGIMAGQIMAGLVGPRLGWRLPFVLVAVPSLVLALVFFAFVREPARGQAEEALAAAGVTGGTAARGFGALRRVLGVRTNQVLLTGIVLGTVPWAMLLVYMNDYFVQEKGFPVPEATMVMAAFGVATLGGAAAGGWLADRVARWSPRWVPVVSGAISLLAALPLLAMIRWPSQIGAAHPQVLVPVLLSAVAGLLLMIPAPTGPLMLLNVNTPESRGTAFSLERLAQGLAYGFGPLVVGAMIVAVGRQRAFELSLLFMPLAWLWTLQLARFYPRDAVALDAELRSRAAAATAGAA